MEELQKFLSTLVKCVYTDGDHVSVVKGELVSLSDNFVEIRTRENLVMIRVEDIRKIQRALNKEEGGQG